MKKCPICGAISSEKSEVCGVCSSSLEEVQPEPVIAPSLGLHSTGAVSSHVKTGSADRRTQGILGLLFGIGMVVTGIFLLWFIALVGFLMLLFGFTVIATDMSWMRGNTFYDIDEPILHGRARLNAVLHYPSETNKKEKAKTETPAGASSQRRDDEKE